MVQSFQLLLSNAEDLVDLTKHIDFTHIHVSVVLFFSLIFFMLPIPPVIKVNRNPAGLRIEKQITQM